MKPKLNIHKMIFIFFILVLTTLSLPATSFPLQRETEPNNSIATANIFNLDGNDFVGQFYGPTDVDVFKFHVPTPGILTFVVRQLPGGRASIRNSNNDILAMKNLGSPSNSVTLQANIVVPGDYYLFMDGDTWLGPSNEDYIVTPSFSNEFTPIVTTGPATNVTTAGVKLNGTVNAKNGSTTVTFQYGLTIAYGNTVTADQSPVTGNTNTAVSKVITGLLPNKIYFYRVVASTSSNGTATGGDQTFNTGNFRYLPLILRK
jgi:hypothetical protein